MGLLMLPASGEIYADAQIPIYTKVRESTEGCGIHELYSNLHASIGDAWAGYASRMPCAR